MAKAINEALNELWVGRPHNQGGYDDDGLEVRGQSAAAKKLAAILKKETE